GRARRTDRTRRRAAAQRNTPDEHEPRAARTTRHSQHDIRRSRHGHKRPPRRPSHTRPAGRDAQSRTVMASESINIGTRESRKRRVFGFASLAAGALLAFGLVVAGAPWWSRAVVFFPVWLAALGLLQ